MSCYQELWFPNDTKLLKDWENVEDESGRAISSTNYQNLAVVQAIMVKV